MAPMYANHCIRVIPLVFAFVILFDLGTRYNVELVWLRTRGIYGREPKAFNGLSARHGVLLAFAVVFSYLFCSHVRQFTPGVVCMLVLWGVYCGLLIWDVFRDVPWV